MPSDRTFGLRGLFRTVFGRRTAPRPAAAPAVPAEDRVPDLDGLRGVAILLVVLYHLTAPVWALERLGYPFTQADWCVAFALYGGWAGVDLFFVLSGFLITGILLRAKGRPGYYRNFYLRRALRIMPLYYAVLLARVLLARTSVPWLAVDHAECLSHAAFLGNFWRCYAEATGRPFDTGGLQVYWSLAIEEQFYLVWPLVVALTPREWLKWVCGAGVVLALGCRWGLTASGANYWLPYALTPCRMDALLFGALVALAATGGSPPAALARRGWLLLAVFGVATAAIVVKCSGPFHHVRVMAAFGYTAYAGLFAAVVLLVVAGQPAGWRVLRSRPLRLIGAHSYAIYLVHFPFVLFGNYLMIKAWPVLHPLAGAIGTSLPVFALYFAFVLGASLLLARITWVVIERPFLKLKERFPMAGPSSRPAA
jgi:peptidoglycan/LPS O-acetylase OafA/YrhL